MKRILGFMCYETTKSGTTYTPGWWEFYTSPGRVIGYLTPPAHFSRVDIARMVWGNANFVAPASELDPDFAEKFLTFIVREVIRHHEQAKSGAPS